MRKLHDSASDSLASESDGTVAGSGRAYCASVHATEPDPLSDVLRTVRLTGALFFSWNISWPYVTPVPDGRTFAPIVLPGAQQIISYHIVTHGSCWAGTCDAPAIALNAGDILLIPHGDAYVMSSSADACVNAPVDDGAALAFFRQMAAGELPFEVVEGGGESTSTKVICGFLGCDVRPFNPILAALPRLVRIRAPTESAQDRLRSLIDYTLAESQHPRPGSHGVLLRLSELLFVEVLRRYFMELPAGETGWLAGLRDPVVGRALVRLHSKPAQPWTLETLAGEVGISRSRLAELFTQLIGKPPMQYLAQWRIQLAARLLVDSSSKVATVAREVGYESEAAFSRAFKRSVGMSPARWRAGAERRTA